MHFTVALWICNHRRKKTTGGGKVASGAEHTRASVATSIPIGLGVGMVTYGMGAKADIAWAAGFGASAGCLVGILLTPDLDQITVTKGEWVVVKWLPVFGWLWLAIWDLYARCIPHRHALSHLPGLGTLGRLFYLIGVLYPLWLLSGRSQLPQLPPAWRPVILSLLFGILISDSLHWAMDGFPLQWGGENH